LRDQALIDRFNKLIGEGKTISEIAIVSNQKPPTIIRSTVRDHDGTTAADYPEYRRLVARRSWWEMFHLLNNPKVRRYFKIDEDLGSGETVLFKVRLIIDPAFLRDALIPTLTKSAWLAALAVGGVVLLTSLLSAVAFRTIGQIVRMLDQFERGEFQPQELPPPAKGAGELSVIASKVNLLGERLRNVDRLLQDLEDAVFIFNRQMRLVFASGSVHRFLGRDRADLPGQQMQDVFPPGTALGLLIGHAAQIGHPIRNRRVAIHTDGEERVGPAAVMLSVDILPDDRGLAGGGVLVRLRDPEAQRQIGRELETAGRLAAISQVSSGVAHEVKNPLNAILLHVEVAKAKLSAGDTDVGQQMEIISSEILRLDRVVRTFLDFTRPVELKVTKLPLQVLVQEIADLASPQAAAANIQVELKQDAGSAEIRVDRDLLKQAVLNVVVNAMQAMPDGGSLTIESSAREMAEIRITDTGCGIPPELRERIFRLYFSTKQNGSGIGLAMTFRIVQLLDGTIDFTSEPGKGTTFLIRLPIAV
jgi:signal transduction histidine kinase